MTSLRELQKPLYLSTKTKPSRREVLNSSFVRSRLDPESLGPAGRSGNRDREHLRAFYGNPQFRMELWRLETNQERNGPDLKRSELRPPSLERGILRNHLGLLDVEMSENDGGGAALLERLKKDVASRLEAWPSLNDRQRKETTQIVFAWATIEEDGAIIEEACRKVEALREEFAEILDASSGEDEVGQGDADWQAACRQLSGLAAIAVIRPADEAVLSDMRRTIGTLERFDARALFQDLQIAAKGLLDEVREDRSCYAIDDEALAAIKGRWSDLGGVPPSAARNELERLRDVYPASVGSVRKAASRYEKTEQELENLRANAPPEGGELRGATLRDWQDRRKLVRERAGDLLVKRREAEAALLECLAPSSELIAAEEPRFERAVTSGPEPPTSDPPVRLDASRAARREAKELGERIKALESELRSSRQEHETLRRKFGNANRELASLKSGWRHAEGRNGQAAPEFILGLAARKQEPTPFECIEAIGQHYGDRCVILDSARESARDMDQFRHGRRLLRMLLTLVTEYRDTLAAKGDVAARHVFGSNDYAAKESATVMRTKDLKRCRTFRYKGEDVEMFQHLRIGRKEDQRQTIRVHFAWDVEAQSIVIGHCGKHLPRLAKP